MSEETTSNNVMIDEDAQSPEDCNLGEFAAFDASSQPFVTLSDAAKNALIELDRITDAVDVAARRLEVEQAWLQLHFDRGYQHLLYNKRNGGWVMPGQSLGNGRVAPNYEASHCTNIYSSEGDIICAALSIEVPRVEFFPKDPSYAPDQTAAEAATDYKDIWATNNNLEALLADCARIFWNEDRLLLYTRYVLDGQKYGFEEDSEVPLVPEDLDAPPSTEPTGQTGDDEFIEANLGGEPEAKGTEEENTSPIAKSAMRKPRGRVVTTSHGKLDHKVPIGVDDISKMHFVKLFEDLDESLVKAMFPWIAEKISPGSDGTSEVELDRIARENVRQAVLGAYVTGDSMNRHVVVKHSWFRPSNWFDKTIKDEVRAELLEKFPDGCLMMKAGSEFAFARNENLDDHCVIRHAITGKGQNRRALGSNMVSVQKRYNEWSDLQDSFFRRTVPKKWYNSEAFNMETMKNSTNTPGSTGPFSPQPGLTTADQYIMVEPTPQPQASLADFIKYYGGELADRVTGAMPAIFGGVTTDTLGVAQLQRDQALQRVGPSWNSIQWGFAEAAKQAVCCAAACQEDQTINEFIPGRGKVTVRCSDMKGNVLCHPEANANLPESWPQRESKLMMIMDASKGNQQLQALLMSPDNLPALADGLRMKYVSLPGADSVKKQQQEFELLLRDGPQDNPDVEKLQETLQEAQEGMKQAGALGQQIPPEAEGMIQQLQQHIQGLPQKVSSVPVAKDDSENHEVEASTCFKWTNSSEGQRFKYGTDKQKAGFANVLLHRQEHLAVAKMLAAQNASAPQQKPPSQTISSNLKDLPDNVKVQILNEDGIKVTAADFQEHAKNELNKDLAKKAIPEAISVQKNQPQQVQA